MRATLFQFLKFWCTVELRESAEYEMYKNLRKCCMRHATSIIHIYVTYGSVATTLMQQNYAHP